MKEDVKIKDLKMIRLIDIENPKIVKMMEDRNILADKINKCSKDIEDTQREQRKLGLKFDRLKEKMKPHVEKEIKKIPTNQWEQLTQVKLDKGKIQFEIVDYVESYKAKIIERKKKDEKKH